jgi:hypothetical protein
MYGFKLSVETQLNEIKIMVEEQKIFSYHRFGELFSNFQNKISIYALDMVLQQLQLDVPLKDCTGSFNKVYGISCRSEDTPTR